ncbi:MAG: aspartate--tRNA ligase [Gemmatimonadetes bacterium]|nr:aspartate--tRNA ligase [Gemmatimonadota bacterium]MCB9517501.1 aspartate--tRNA ligase [Gemmatimonadales bacterium]HRX19481.1 aspartate--tRNA ligase [Gemmatimonadales bacterium]
MAQTALRTHRGGSLTASHIGTPVRLGGWIHRRRDLGGIVFLDLRDRDGLVQLSCDPAWTPAEVLARAAGLGAETVVLVEGTVERRQEPGRDPAMTSREVEVRVTALQVVGPAATPAIPVARREGEEPAAEDLRLTHRILDLRRPELQANFILRHRLLQRARRVLSDLGFLEIETPILTKPTPEGARDYLVPSRVHPGECYALPQSPQIYKQLLMVAGFDRYFQLARCFRDEDLRADRQPEFTQIDLEASFVAADDVMAVVEQVLVALWAEAGESVEGAFPRLRWREAMERYGIDKPDLRFGLEIQDLSAIVGGEAAPFLRDALASGGRLRAILAPGLAVLSRRELDDLGERAKAAGAGGLLWARRTDAGWEGQGVKAIGVAGLDTVSAEPGSLLVAVVGPDTVTHAAMHAVRSALGARPEVPRLRRHAFAWVVDFPLFEQEPETGAWIFTHHPFTAPHPDDRDRLASDPGSCRAQHYDAVYNGNELGSGSIRITDPALQAEVFGFLGIGPEEQRTRFGFLLDALATGAPPHGGFALGFDRIAMLLAGASSLRDVIAFPKTTQARALLEGAPVPVSAAELAALHLTTRSEGGPDVR